jgi:hypothetical protein
VTPLLELLQEHPGAAFEITIALPSGCICHGVVGPLIGDRIAGGLGFTPDPTQKDIDFATGVVSQLIGAKPEHVSEKLNSRQEMEAHRRKFMGGGLG